MRKVNFNNLNNIEIPESWTQKALNLPNAPVKKKSVFALSSFYRRLSFVACCVLACALSVAIFGFMKNDILPQKTPAESTVNSTAYNTSSSETATQNSGITQKPTSVKPTKNIEPTEEATENPTQSESDNSSTQTPEPTEKPTQKVTQKPTSSKPTTPQIPTQSPTEVPEDTPDTPDPPAFESNDVCVGYVDESLLYGSSTVYCFVVPTNSDIAFPESPDTYIADVSHIGNGSVRISFAGKNSTYVKQSDFYTFYFYNINGEVIYENTIYITIK